jgi:uncharacterized protein (UPF0332 family)
VVKVRLDNFIKRGLFRKVRGIERLTTNFINRARHNLLISKILYKISIDEKVKEMLMLTSDFQVFDWVVITGYYAMYHAALACIASIGFKSDNHTATILALERFFVRRGKLEKKFLEKIKRAKRLEEEYIRKIKAAKRRREVAQYDVTTSVEQMMAEVVLKDADEFIERIEKLLA